MQWKPLPDSQTLISGFFANMVLDRHARYAAQSVAGKKSDGTYGYQDNFSPEAWLDSKSFVNRKNKFFLGGVEMAWEIFKGFTLSGKAGYNYNTYNNKSYAASFTFDQFKTVGPNNLNVNSGNNGLITLQSLAKYTKQIGSHTISALAGFSQESYKESWITAYRNNFPNNELYEINAGASGNMQSYVQVLSGLYVLISEE